MTEHPFDWLACPHCGGPLSRHDGALSCPNHHSFDIARQGYVNLLGHAAPHNADTPAMLDARARFLGSHLYDPIADDVVAAVGKARRIVEVGAGTGFYLGYLLDELPEAIGLATDVSPAAAKRAARAHPRAASIVADTWAGLPLRDGVADAILCVFAPRNSAEFARILAPGGRLVVVVPTAKHLAGLRERHGLLDVSDDKADTVAAAFPGWRSRRSPVDYQMALTGTLGADLVAMGPNAFHTPPSDIPDEFATVSVTVMTFIRPE
ncbi:MAG: methyltransferase domain-containing protein [Propionibacteriaceae bacterium]|nr:methyltransferase domain-containing protein [Propionibacteriaceae bacterium]